MNSIQELMNKEADIVQRRRDGEFANKADLRSAIEGLLDKINSQRGNIATLDEWRWACAAIIRWDSFLRSRFGTSKGTRIPPLPDLPHAKASEHPKIKEALSGKATCFDPLSRIENKVRYLRTLPGMSLEKGDVEKIGHMDSLLTGMVDRLQRRAVFSSNVELVAYKDQCSLEELLLKRDDIIRREPKKHEYIQGATV